MPVIRLVLLLAVLGGMTLFALQNWSPAVPLVFLGMQTQALPLAVWMVGAIAAGAFTTLVIAGLFGLSNTFSTSRGRAASKREANRFSNTSSPSWDGDWTEPKDSYSAASTSTTSTKAASTTNSTAEAATSYSQSESPKPKSGFNFRNDWENVGAPIEEWEDWQDYEEPVDTSRAQASPQASSSSSSYNSQTYIQEPEEEREEWEEEPEAPSQTPVQPQRTDYEVRRDPKTSYQSGSVYSYSYREPSDSGVGKTESVYDADYRVIIPPARSLDELGGEPAPNQNSDEDDWDFDDDFEAGDRPRR